MSLLTPPSTQHRGLTWSSRLNNIHLISNDDLACSLMLPSAKRLGPAKSILKPPSILPFEDDQSPLSTREATPEPSDPLTNLTYLQTPLETILNSNIPLRDLTQAYSILAARLRSTVPDTGEFDASCPLFSPIRSNIERLTERICEDLKKAFVDPCPPQENCKSLPPSPKPSPKRLGEPVKKVGMTAEQAKYGRDLCTTVHAILKLLTFVFSLPSLFALFNEEQLHSIFCSVLNILSQQRLPTPHSRKTWALSIWVVQAQRLPESVLDATKDRVTYVLSRAISGQLGKEGKKGSKADGLRAIHDLCAHLPQVFVPAFLPLLEPLIDNLCLPSAATRLLAAQAFGSLAKGLADIPADYPDANEHRWNLARHLQHLLWDETPLARPASPLKRNSPAKGNPVSPTAGSQGTSHSLIKAIRLSFMNNDTPAHPGASPVWSIAILASLTVILAPVIRLSSRRTTSPLAATVIDYKVIMSINALLTLGMRAKKAALRELCSVVSRVLIWVYTSPQLDGPEPESDDGEDEVSEASQQGQKQDKLLEVILNNSDCGIGCTFLYSILSADENDIDRPAAVSAAMEMLARIVERERQTERSSFGLLRRLLGTTSPPATSDVKTLVPESIFTIPYPLSLVTGTPFTEGVQDVIAECPNPTDVPSLRREEATLDFQKGAEEWQSETWSALLRAFRVALGGMKDKNLESVVEIWKTLLLNNVDACQDKEDAESLSAFTELVFETIASIVLDQDLKPELTPAIFSSGRHNVLPSSGLMSKKAAQASLCSTSGLRRMHLFRLLWHTARSVIPATYLTANIGILVENLAYIAKANVGSSRIPISSEEEDERKVWALLCADIVSVDEDARALQVAWEATREWETEGRKDVWRLVAQQVAKSNAHWEIGATLLAMPFGHLGVSWSLSSDDWGIHAKLMESTRVQAIDFGREATVVAETICDSILDALPESKTAISIPSLADAILCSIEESISDVLPTKIVELISQIMVVSYPPHLDLPANCSPSRRLAGRRNVPGATGASQTECMWLLRTLTRLVENASVECFEGMVQGLKDGLEVWFEDSELSIDDGHYSFNIEPLYAAVLSRIGELPRNAAVLKELEDVVAAPFNSHQPEVLEARKDLLEQFHVFWQASYVHTPEPEEGWPGKVDMCLRMVAGDYVAPEVVPTREASPTISELDFAPVQPNVEPTATTTTPTQSPSRQSTPPPRSADVFTTPNAGSVPSTPAKSIAWLTTVMNPTTPHSPPKRSLFMSSHDKENTSPLVHTPRSSVKRKVAAADEGERRQDPETPTRGNKAARRMSIMKGRMRRSSISEDEDSVSRMLFPKPSSPSPSESFDSESESKKPMSKASQEPMTPKAEEDKSSTPRAHGKNTTPKAEEKNTTPKAPQTGTKRKRQVMECVEIVTKSSAWLARFGDGESPSARSVKTTEKFGPPARKLRRVASAPSHRRVSSGTPSVVTTATTTEDAGSETEPEPELPSSDDDPHYGQVTPRHLISPTLFKARSSTRSTRTRRTKFLFDLSNRSNESSDEDELDQEDPPSSDDAYAPPSPSKLAEERRFRRTSSGQLRPALSA